MKKIKYKDYYQNLLKEAEHKIYVKKGQSPPEGKKLQTGPRGGQFFTGTAAEKEKFSKKSAPKSEPKSPKRKSDSLHNDWEDDASDTSAHDIQYGQMKKEMLDKLTDTYEEDYLDQGYEPDEALDAAEEMANDDINDWADDASDDEIDKRYKEIMGVSDKKETSAGSAGVGKSRGTDAPSSQPPKKDSGLSAYKEKAKNSINPKIWDTSKLNDADIEALSNRDDGELEDIKRFSNDYNMTPQMAAQLYDNTEGLKKKKKN